MSSASFWGIPWSRAFSRIDSTKPRSRSWIMSGEEMGPSSSRNWERALKHSAVIWFRVSMAVTDLPRSRAALGHGQELQLDVLGAERGRQVDGDQAFLDDLAPEFVLQGQREIGNAGADRNFRRRAVGDRDGDARRRRGADHLRQLRARRDLAQPRQPLGQLRLRNLGTH